MKRTIVDIKIITKTKNKTKYINCFYIYFNIYLNYLNYFFFASWISWTDFMSHSIFLRILWTSPSIAVTLFRSWVSPRVSLCSTWVSLCSTWVSLCSTWVSLYSTWVSLWSIWLILGAKNLNYIMLFTIILINWIHFYKNLNIDMFYFPSIQFKLKKTVWIKYQENYYYSKKN